MKLFFFLIKMNSYIYIYILYIYIYIYIYIFISHEKKFFEKNNVTIAVNALYPKKEKIYPSYV